MPKVKTAEQLIALATDVLNNSNIVDEDLRQDVYLYVLSNDLCNEKSRTIKSRIKDFIISRLIKKEKEDDNNSNTIAIKSSYDQLALYSILADLLFNRLDRDLASAILIKYGLDPAIGYDDNFTHKRVEELSAEGIKKLKAIANKIVETEA